VKTNAILCASLAALMVCPASAQEKYMDKYNFGLSGSRVSPGNDMAWGDGLGLAGFAERRLARLFSVRLRAEYIKFGDKERLFAAPVFAVPYDPNSYNELYDTFKVSYSTKMFGGMADFVLGRKDKGLYGFASVGYLWADASARMRRNDPPSSSEFNGLREGDYGNDYSSFAWALGFGYNFSRRFGVEAKSTALDRTGGNSDFNDSFAQVSLLYRF